MITWNPPLTRVEAALVEISGNVRSPSLGLWEYALCGRESLTVTARADEGWLMLHTIPGRGRKFNATSANRAWHLLRLGEGLPGGVKYALDDHSRVCIRAELPIDPFGGVDVGRVTEAAEGFQAAATRYSSKRRSSSHPANDATPCSTEEQGEASSDIERLCDEARWPYAVRGTGSIVAQLDVPERFQQALLAKRKDSLHIETHLQVDAAAPPVCRRAMGVLLLTVNAVVRMARVVTAADGTLMPRIEVVQAWRPTAAQLIDALNALSVACRLCGSEVEALLDETVAAEFLKARGWSS